MLGDWVMKARNLHLWLHYQLVISDDLPALSKPAWLRVPCSLVLSNFVNQGPGRLWSQQVYQLCTGLLQVMFSIGCVHNAVVSSLRQLWQKKKSMYVTWSEHKLNSLLICTHDQCLNHISDTSQSHSCQSRITRISIVTSSYWDYIF